MALTAKKKMDNASLVQYSEAEKKAFVRYFSPDPPKRKRGRPKKKKRLRKKKKQKVPQKSNQVHLSHEETGVVLEGVAAVGMRTQARRVNSPRVWSSAS